MNLMNAVLPADVARSLGLARAGDSAMLEVQDARPDGTVVVEYENEAGGDLAEDAREVSQAPPELIAALNGSKSAARPPGV